MIDRRTNEERRTHQSRRDGIEVRHVLRRRLSISPPAMTLGSRSVACLPNPENEKELRWLSK